MYDKIIVYYKFLELKSIARLYGSEMLHILPPKSSAE